MYAKIKRLDWVNFTLKLKTSEMFSAPIKGRSPCYASLHCEGYGHMRTWNIHKVIYRDQSCVVELLLQLENKQQIMQNNVAHVFVIYWKFVKCRLPYGTLYLHSDFKGVHGNLNYRGRKHLWIVFCFTVCHSSTFQTIWHRSVLNI